MPPDWKRGLSLKFNIRDLIKRETTRREALVAGQVVPEPARCVQCGICSYACPIGIDVRRHAWLGEPIQASECLTCGECVARCPRGVLQFERTSLFQLGGDSYET
jgi:ferredoxin